MDRLALGAPELDKILKEILYFGGRAELDTAGLKTHLMLAGLAASLAGFMRPDLYKLWAFAGPSADLAVARTGLEHLLERFHERRLEAEVETARMDLAATDSVESEARLTSLQHQLHRTGLRGTALEDEDIGQPSG